jgi:alpha-N-acetylglucosaminidase
MNPITWDLLWEMGWANVSPALEPWVASYVGRRYGTVTDAPLVQEAWRTLVATQYTKTVGYVTSHS